MANEIKVTSGLSCTNVNLKVPSTTATNQFNQTTARGGTICADIGTSEETIAFGDVAPGWVEMVNTDATNYVQVGFSTAVYGMRLLAAKGSATFYLESGATIYAKANTATCIVQITAINA